MNRIYYFIYLSLLSLLSLLVLNCRKEKDMNSPSIKLLKPSKGTVYSVYDTIWIEALISDESKLESVKVSLLDEDQKPVLATQIFKPINSAYELVTALPIDDIHLSGGNYSIQIKAYNGTNYTNLYLEIQINEIPKELKSIVLVSDEGIYGTGINFLNGIGNWQRILLLGGDYKTSDINSYNQQIYTAGAFSGNLNATFLPSGQVIWQVPLISSPPYRYYEDVFYSRPILYTAYYFGNIYGYNNEGAILYSTNILPSYFPEKLGILDNKPLACMKSKTGKINILAVYYPSSGIMMQSCNLPLDVIAFKTIDNDNVLLFGNDEEEGKIMEYTLSQNKLRLLNNFTDGKICAVTDRDAANFFIAGSTAIYWYIRPTNTLVEFIPQVPGALVDFDIVNDRLYTLSNHHMVAYDFGNGSPVINIPVADSALALHLLYNK
jgi:hypothetical protein